MSYIFLRERWEAFETMSRTKKDTPNAKRAKLMRKDGGAFSCADVRDNGKPLGYWDDTGRCNRSRRNAQKTGSHRRRAILKRRMMLLNLE